MPGQYNEQLGYHLDLRDTPLAKQYIKQAKIVRSAPKYVAQGWNESDMDVAKRLIRRDIKSKGGKVGTIRI